MNRDDFDVRVFASRFSSLLEQSKENTHTLAKKLALSPATISRYANGIMTPKLITLYAIADIFEVNPLWLMGFETQKQPNITQNYLTFTSNSSPQTQALLVFNKNGIAGGHEKIIPSDDVLNEINKLAQALKPYPAEQINALLKIVEKGGNIPIKTDMSQELKELIAATANLSAESIRALIQVAKTMK